MRRAIAVVSSLLPLWLGAIAASAAEYPTKPVTLVVGFTPGGPSDVMSRILGGKLETLLGQPFVILNRPGAGGNLAAEMVARAEPDGHTLLMGNNSILATNASLYKRLGFDPEQDFAPISLVGLQANILVVNPKLPVTSLAELVAMAKAAPGQLNYASSGHGAAAHLAGELFKSRAAVDIVHVAYKGAAPALQDVISGQVEMMFATSSAVIEHIRAGTVRALAVTTPRRTALMPELPTIAELGFPGFDATTWHGLVAPAATPREAVSVLYGATVTALRDAAVARSMADLGIDVVAGSPTEFAAYIASEIPKWTKVVKDSGARLD